jgi:hypothetical protein
MVLPPGLQSDAQVMPVSGRQGGIICNPAIRFGPFHADEVQRGITAGSQSTWSFLAERERWEARRRFSFVLGGAGPERWSVRCVAAAGRVHLEEPVGIGTRANGDFGVLRKVAESSAWEVLDCDFDGGEGRRRRLHLSDADESGFGGVLTDDWGVALARIRASNDQIKKPYEYTVPSPLGFLVETNGGLQLAVERAFDGKVIFDRATPSAEQAPLAALATALLLWDRLR